MSDKFNDWLASDIASQSELETLTKVCDLIDECKGDFAVFTSKLEGLCAAASLRHDSLERDAEKIGLASDQGKVVSKDDALSAMQQRLDDVRSEQSDRLVDLVSKLENVNALGESHGWTNSRIEQASFLEVQIERTKKDLR
ncbi:hypothetical protein N9D23_03175 [Rubripirellula sp.]|nr:hypothetical protein [Rubripirellula sp.]MDF1844733.1 hypothetical protein [Rubripirellula sp.]